MQSSHLYPKLSSRHCPEMSSRLELCIPERNAKWSGGTCCLTRPRVWISQQNKFPLMAAEKSWGSRKRLDCELFFFATALEPLSSTGWQKRISQNPVVKELRYQNLDNKSLAVRSFSRSDRHCLDHDGRFEMYGARSDVTDRLWKKI